MTAGRQLSGRLDCDTIALLEKDLDDVTLAAGGVAVSRHCASHLMALCGDDVLASNLEES